MLAFVFLCWAGLVRDENARSLAFSRSIKDPPAPIRWPAFDAAGVHCDAGPPHGQGRLLRSVPNGPMSSTVHVGLQRISIRAHNKEVLRVSLEVVSTFLFSILFNAHTGWCFGWPFGPEWRKQP